jgi:selT/selW/selH-like putative selenoprotein
LAAKIRESLGIEPRLIPEGRGIFDVVVDGKLVYSKFETGTFPENDQLVDLLLLDYGGQRD